MKSGSLFDGSGTAPLSAALCGICPVWASEIEPYAIRVTKARFPNMKHLGDITKINGAEIEPVDILVGGSPCQDLSVAGKQSGLNKGERSHLFFEMTRIIQEMRRATSGEYPKYVVWENVPGAFSSQKGEDFYAVINSFAQIADPDINVPRPPKKGDRLAWKNAGCIVADGWSIAWRVVDAQYWGVPQRRRRIYLVLDLTDRRAGEILFERKGVCGDIAQSGETRERTADDAAGGAGRSGGVKCLTPWDYQTKRQYAIDGVYPTISAQERSRQNQQGICYAFHLQQDPISDETKSPCIGGQHQACVGVAAFMGGQGAKAGSIGYSENVVPTLKNAASGTNQAPDVVYPQIARCLEARHDSSPCVDRGQNVCVYALQGNGIDRADTAGCNGCGWREGQMYTLNTIDRPAVYFEGQNVCSDSDKAFTIQAGRPDDHHIPSCAYCYDCRGNGDGQTAANLTSDHENRVTDHTNCVCFDFQRIGQYGNGESGSTLKSRDYKDATDLVVEQKKQNRKYIVRRLTPLECCRLQGFPDCWTDGVNGSDSAQYKMWGNGMALPNMLFVIRRIAEHEATK